MGSPSGVPGPYAIGPEAFPASHFWLQPPLLYDLDRLHAEGR